MHFGIVKTEKNQFFCVWGQLLLSTGQVILILKKKVCVCVSGGNATQPHAVKY